uniref:Perilipin n=1 Tax=Sphenodon punctatus TaxID=8508 RepID=A0A8D0GSY3_SPHPU
MVCVELTSLLPSPELFHCSRVGTGSTGQIQGPNKKPSIVTRVASLPLISSAYNLVSLVYNYAKGTHPYISTVCSVAETVAAMAIGSAMGGAQPILNRLEPQIATANEYACKGLDKLEETLPILHQPTEKLTKSVVTSTVNTARDATSDAKQKMTTRVNEVVGKSREAVQEGVEMTSFIVTHSVNKTKAVGQIVVSGVDAMLRESEDLVDHYLPMTDEELAALATSIQGVKMASVEQQKRQQSYFVRLGSLSIKVRQRAYQHSLTKLRHLKQNIQDPLSQLQLAIDLIELAQQSVGRKLQEAQQKLHQIVSVWKQSEGTDAAKPEQVEPHTLAMLRLVTQDLQPTYECLMASIQGLPSGIMERVERAVESLRQLHASFSRATSFQDLSSNTLAQSKEKVFNVREVLDSVLEYVTHNTPVNWLVGPFSPSLKEDLLSAKDPKEQRDLGRSKTRGTAEYHQHIGDIAP